MRSRIPNLEIDEKSENNMKLLEEKLKIIGHGPKTFSWKETADATDEDEIAISNTFLN